MSLLAAELHKLDPDRIVERVERMLIDTETASSLLVNLNGKDYVAALVSGTYETGKHFQTATYTPAEDANSQTQLPALSDALPFTETTDFRVRTYQSNNGEFLQSVQILDSYRIWNDFYCIEMTRYNAVLVDGESILINRIFLGNKNGMMALFDFPYSGLHGDDLSTMLASLEL